METLFQMFIVLIINIFTEQKYTIFVQYTKNKYKIYSAYKNKLKVHKFVDHKLVNLENN